jgi:lysophospholipase L1-like esterase
MFDIVMIGSSIFEFWQQPSWGKLKIANHGIRSTSTQHWLEYDLSKLPKAKCYLLYCGSNDLIFGLSPYQSTANCTAIINELVQLHPDAQVGYFSIIKCPQKQEANQLALIDDMNQKIQTDCNGQMDYFDLNQHLENDQKWFNDDGLHLTEDAYAMLDEKLSPVMKDWVKAK